eukprot:4274315-Heterocapsa_arctica.AAC.1
MLAGFVEGPVGYKGALTQGHYLHVSWYAVPATVAGSSLFTYDDSERADGVIPHNQFSVKVEPCRRCREQACLLSWPAPRC